MTNQKFKLKQSNTPQEGEVAQAENGKLKIFQGGEWKDLNVEGSNLELGLYEINKQIISQLPALTDFSKAIVDIRKLHEKYWNKYYMMYGKEISYFTLFKVCGLNDFGQDVIDCCTNVGIIKSMDLTETNDAIEIWIQPEEAEPTCLYLFPYDSGIVEVGK